MDVAPAPMFVPSDEDIASTQMTAFVRFVERCTGRHFDGASAFHRFSIEERSTFFRLALDWFALAVEGDRAPAIDGDAGESARFFPNLRLSFAENLLAGAADRKAIVSIVENGARHEISRGELSQRVLSVASALSRRGVAPGDRVVAIAQNTIESVVACLATLAVGATWSSIAPNVGVDAALDRFGQLAPKVMFAHGSYPAQGVVHDVSSSVRRLVDAVPSLELLVALDGDTEALGERSVTLGTLREEGSAGPFRALGELPRFPFDHPAYILFSSGTTGRPKCIVHGAGGTLLEHVKEHRLHSDLRPGDKLFFHTATGWMMWNWLVSALASQVTLVLYEGLVSHPTPDALWRIVADERVQVFGTSPGYLQYSRDAGIEPRSFDLSALRAVQSTGSVLGDDLFDWVAEHVARLPLQSISGGTDLIGCFLLGHPNLPVHRGELQAMSLGYDVACVAPDGTPAPIGSVGELVCRGPFPSRPVGFFGDESGERFHAAYFAAHPGVWTHGDLLELTRHGGARVHGRSDGVLNVRGIRIGPAEIYRALSSSVPEVAEAMAVEQLVPTEIGGSRLVLLVVLRGGIAFGPELVERIRHELRTRCSPAHVPALVLARDALPTTHSGKRSERAARDAVNGRPIGNLGALRNPESLVGLDTACAPAPNEPPSNLAGRQVSIDALCAVFREVLEAPLVRPDDSFFDLGGHSLAGVTLLARVERAFGVRLPMSSLLERAATPRRMAAALGEETRAHASHLVAIRTEGSSPPVFWLPGGGGLSVVAFREVSMRLGRHQPVYGFEARLSLEDAPRSIPEMAKRYVDDLVRAFPNGPYMLFGFSFGSWVAFEMGVELRARGKEVPLLCVFDSPIPVERGVTDTARILLQRASYHARNLASIPAARIPEYVRGTAAVASRRARERLSLHGLRVAPHETTERSNDSVFDELDRRNRAAAAAYVRGTLPTFDGRVTVILAQRTSQSAVSPELDDRLAIARYATGGLEVHRVEGSHLSMLRAPEVDKLAEVLSDCIARASQRSAVAETRRDRVAFA